MKVFKAKAVDKHGMLNLLKLYQSIFRTPENLDYYSPENYKSAERKFLIWCLENRPAVTL